MIIKLTGATFSNNLGTLNSWFISKDIRGADSDIPSAVTKDAALNGTITVKEGYTFSSITIKMGTNTIDAATPSADNKTWTISIPQVTADVQIIFKATGASTGEEDEGGSGDGKNYLDLSSLTWEQGHYDGSGVNTDTSNNYYNYRVRSNFFTLPSDAIGKKLYFSMGDDYRINLRGGSSSSDLTFNYFYIDPTATQEDSGINSASRGYAVTLPSSVTVIRMMMSFKGSSTDDIQNTTTQITPSLANAANLKIWYE